MRSNRATIAVLLLTGCGSLDVSPRVGASTAPPREPSIDAAMPPPAAVAPVRVAAPSIVVDGCYASATRIEITREGTPVWRCVESAGATSCDLAPDQVEESSEYDLLIDGALGPRPARLRLRGREARIIVGAACHESGRISVTREYASPPSVRLVELTLSQLRRIDREARHWPELGLRNESPFVLVQSYGADLEVHAVALDGATGAVVDAGWRRCAQPDFLRPVPAGVTVRAFDYASRPELRTDRRYRFTLRFALEDPSALERPLPDGLGFPPLPATLDSGDERDVFVVTLEREGADLVREAEALGLDHLVGPGEVRPFREGLERARGARRRPRRSRERE